MPCTVARTRLQASREGRRWIKENEMKQPRMIALRLIAIGCLILAVMEIIVGDTTDFYFTTTMILMASGLEAIRFELARIRTSLLNTKESNKASEPTSG